MEIIELLPLKEVTNWEKYGFKAANLGRCISLGLKVPDGLALYFIESDKKNSKIEHFPDELIDWLKKQRGLVAIRSSELVSSNNAGLISGLFKTIRKRPPLAEEICEAINEIIYHSRSVELSEKMKRMFYDFSQKTSVIIQTEVDSLISGVSISTCNNNPCMAEIWFVKGDLKHLVSGKAQGDRLKVPKTEPDTISEVWCSEDTLENATKLGVLDILQPLIRSIKILENSFKLPVQVEWSYDGKDINILQVQHAEVGF